ncbi:MAG: hypothetical protein RI919_766 [Actinomycetota bacterium]
MDAFLFFTVTYLVAAAAPGADTMLIVSRTVVGGWRSALRYAIGIALAKTTMITLAFLGTSALLTANPAAYSVLKVLGAAFLLFMAFKLWRTKAVAGVASESQPQAETFGAKVTTASILGGYLVGISNPQPLLFYSSIVPMVVAAGLNTTADLFILWAIVIIGFGHRDHRIHRDCWCIHRPSIHDSPLASQANQPPPSKPGDGSGLRNYFRAAFAALKIATKLNLLQQKPQPRFRNLPLGHDYYRPVPSQACMDARINVYGVLGLQEGESHVIRNAGGVVTDDEIRSLAISQRLLGTKEIILIHHTDCGMLTFTDDDFKKSIQEEVGIKPEWAAEAFSDLDEDVRQSIARIKSNPFIVHKDAIRGFVFDVATGLLHEVK